MTTPGTLQGTAPGTRYQCSQRRFETIAPSLLQRLSRGALVIGALLLLGRSAAADTYFVPPAPVAIALRAGERAVTTDVDLDLNYPARQLSIQLAVIGTPVRVLPATPPTAFLLKLSIEDAPRPTLAPASRVDASDLSAAATILAAHGIPPADIAVMPIRAAVGEVRVNVVPATATRFAWIARHVGAALRDYRNIVPSGIIASRVTCNAEEASRQTAFTSAEHRAALVAQAAGLELSKTRQTDLRLEASSDDYQTTCGSRGAASPRYEFAIPSSVLLDAYPVSIAGNVTFGARLATPRSAVGPHTIESAPVGPFYFTGRSARFDLPVSQPFVSAYGSYTIAVHPDFRVADFYFPAAGRPNTAIVQAISAGTKEGNLLRVGSNLFVRVTSDDELRRIRASARAARSRDAYRLSVFPFVADCDSARSAVTTAAYGQARARARIMAAEARRALGSVIAVNDVWFDDAAICDVGISAPLKTLVAAIRRLPDVNPVIGDDARFSTTFAVAWQLHALLAKPAPSPQPIEDGIDSSALNYQPFMTDGIGIFGEGATILAAGRLDRVSRSALCTRADATALRLATDRALARGGLHQLRALIEQRPQYTPNASICGLGDDDAVATATSLASSVAEKVLLLLAR